MSSLRYPREPVFAPEEPDARPEVEPTTGLGPDAYRQRLEDEGYAELIPAFERVCAVARAVSERGGRALLVGGAVRDEVLGMPSKDFDVEVYGVPVEDLEPLLEEFGEVDAVGRAFGILKMRAGDADVDFSIPRRESKTGAGHKGFAVAGDPTMTIEEAARRRDFTMNALAKDPLTGEIYDYFGGVADLQKRVLRMTDAERFGDDPLRILRGLQFMARFGLRLDQTTAEDMRRIAPSLNELPRERIGEEWRKLLVKGRKPSLGLAAGMELGVFDALHVEIPPLVSTPQEHEWHPEGDVWVHTMMVVDRAAQLRDREGLTGTAAAIVMFGALCHDFGKPPTTVEDGGRIRSRGHEEAGEKPTRAFLASLNQSKELVEAVVGLVRDHLKPGMFYLMEHPQDPARKPQPVTDGAIRNLAERIAPATLEQLVLVAQADHQGRGPFVDPQEPEQYLLNYYEAGRWFLERARGIGVEREPAPPLLQGRDLIALALHPGREFGAIITLADRLRDEGNWVREEVLGVIHEAAQRVERTREKAAHVIDRLERLARAAWARLLARRVAEWSADVRAERSVVLLDGRVLTPEQMADRVHRRFERIGLHDIGTLTMTLLLRGEPLPEPLAQNRDAILTAHESGPVWFARFEASFYHGPWKSFYGEFENTEHQDVAERLIAAGADAQLRRGLDLLTAPDAERIAAYDREYAAAAPVESDGIFARYETAAYPFERGAHDGHRIMVQFDPETKRLAVSILDEDRARVAELDQRVRAFLPEFADARHVGYLFATRDGRDDVWTSEDGKRVYEAVRRALRGS